MLDVNSAPEVPSPDVQTSSGHRGAIWSTRYQELKNFIEKEHRNPSKYDNTERGLYYNWLRHNMKLFNAGEM